MRESLNQYARDLGLLMWAVFVGFIFALGGVALDWLDFPNWVWGLCIGAMLFVPYWAYHKQRLRFEATVQSLKNEIDSLSRNRHTVEAIRRLLQKSQDLFSLRKQRIQTDEQLEEWIRRVESEAGEIADQIRTISEIDADNFLIIPSVPAQDFTGAYNNKHNKYLSKLVMYHDRLQALIDRYSERLTK